MIIKESAKIAQNIGPNVDINTNDRNKNASRIKNFFEKK
jgi:hypothetical protein